MSNFFSTVREPLVAEAIQSPNLLADLAGLEKYIAESYSSRSFIELLQNADDAGSSRMLVKRSGRHIIIANDGRTFTVQDFEALCRSAASKKDRQTNIGFRGIGFKSVVGFANRIHIISGDLEATFSRELTAALVPEATFVPLIRIPHPIDQELRSMLSIELDTIINQGYKTIFIFSDLIADYIESEFDALEPTALLFLHNVSEIFFETETRSIQYLATRDVVGAESSLIRVSYGSYSQLWAIFCHDYISIAIQKFDDQFVRCSPDEAVVHAFLPTSEDTGFGFKVNGDISTDPSRLRVVFDENTFATVQKMAELYVRLLKASLSSDNDLSRSNLLEVLIPLFDPTMTHLQKESYKKCFMRAINECASGQFDNYYRRPGWLNPADSAILAQKLKISIPPRDLGETDGLNSLLKALGVNELSFEKISVAFKCPHLSIKGAAEIVAYLSNMFQTGRLAREQFNNDWEIWFSNGKNSTLTRIIQNREKIDDEFVDLITEIIGMDTALPYLLKALTTPETAKMLLPLQHKAISQKQSPPVNKNTFQAFTASETAKTLLPFQHKTAFQVQSNSTTSLLRWRSAENQVLDIFLENGWSAKDVSRQNLGYDIEAQTPNGKEFFIEVKSINYEGQEFALTNNELTTANSLGESYVLAVVLQKKDILNVMFIEDPLKSLKFEKQCRNWVWLCSDYSFTPYTFDLSLTENSKGP